MPDNKEPGGPDDVHLTCTATMCPGQACRASPARGDAKNKRGSHHERHTILLYACCRPRQQQVQLAGYVAAYNGNEIPERSAHHSRRLTGCTLTMRIAQESSMLGLVQDWAPWLRCPKLLDQKCFKAEMQQDFALAAMLSRNGVLDQRPVARCRGLSQESTPPCRPQLFLRGAPADSTPFCSGKWHAA